MNSDIIEETDGIDSDETELKIDKDEVKNKIWMVFEEGDYFVEGVFHKKYIAKIFGFYKSDTEAEKERRKRNCKKRDYVLR